MKHIYLTIAVVLSIFYWKPVEAQDQHQRGPYLEGNFMFAPFYQLAMYNGGLKVGYQFNSKIGFGLATSSYTIAFSSQDSFEETKAGQLTGIYYRRLKERWIFSSEIGVLTKPLTNNLQRTLNNPLYLKQDIGYALTPALLIGTFFNYIPRAETKQIYEKANNTKTSSYFHPSVYVALNLNKTSLSIFNNKFSNRIPYIKKKKGHIDVLENTEKLHLNRLYTDAHIGWFDFGDLKMADVDISLGYQKKHYSGLGIGINYMSAGTVEKSCNYTGIGLQYRFINDWIIIKPEIGKVIGYNFGIDNLITTAEQNYEYIKPNGLNYYLRLNSGLRLGDYVKLGYSVSYLPNLVKEEGQRIKIGDDWNVNETSYKPVLFGLNVGVTLPM
jgi:hypothetical protein